MNYRSFKKDFRMNAKEFERFDRVRRNQGCGFRPWSDFIRDALVKYVEAAEASNPGRYPPQVTPPSLVEHFREKIREKPTPLPPIAADPAPEVFAEKVYYTKKKPAASTSTKKARKK